MQLSTLDEIRLRLTGSASFSVENTVSRYFHNLTLCAFDQSFS